MQAASNSTNKLKLLRLILSIVFILSAVLIANPNTVYAAFNQNGSAGSGDMPAEEMEGPDILNGETENGFTGSLSYLCTSKFHESFPDQVLSFSSIMK